MRNPRQEARLVVPTHLVEDVLVGARTYFTFPVKPTPPAGDYGAYWVHFSTDKACLGTAQWMTHEGALSRVVHRVRAPMLLDQRLWLAEPHVLVPLHGNARGQKWSLWGGLPYAMEPQSMRAAYYRANFDRCADHRWRPATQMPRWASRADFVVDEARVCRLGDLVDADVMEQFLGPRAHMLDGQPVPWPLSKVPGYRKQPAENPLQAFRWEWEDTHGAWDRDRWIWRFRVKRVVPPTMPEAA